MDMDAYNAKLRELGQEDDENEDWLQKKKMNMKKK